MIKGLPALSTVVLVCVLLAACGGAPSAAQRAFDQLQRAGLATNAHAAPAVEPDSPIGRCGDRLAFDIPGASAGASGIILACEGLNLDTFGNAVIYHSAGRAVHVLVLGAPEVAPRIGEQVQQIKE